jgi:WD40 repeat protein
LAWGDEEGNCFAWSLPDERLLVVYDHTVSKMATQNDKAGLFRVETIRFVGEKKLNWVDHAGRIGIADVPGERIQKPTLRGWDAGPVWSSTIGNGFFFVCVPVRNKILTNETVLEKYDLSQGKYIATAKLDPMKSFVEGMDFSTDKELLAVVTRSNAGIVTLNPFKLQRTIDVQCGDNIVFSPDSSQLAIGTNGVGCNSLVVADVGTGRVVREVKTPPSSVRVLAWSPTGDVWYESAWHVYRLGSTTKEPKEVFGLESGVPVIRPVAMVFVNQGRRFFFGMDSGEVVEFEASATSLAGPETKAAVPQ